MIGVGRQASGFNQPQKQALQVTTIPAPNSGIDTQSALGAKNIENSIYAYNVIPDESGMQVRPGYREWTIGLDNGLATGVKTIIVFDGSQTFPSDNRLFAVTNEGIWDCTVYDTPVFTAAVFADTTDPESGQGVFAHYTDQGGDNFLYYADGANGLWEYTEATDLWAPATGITGTGLDLTEVAFVMVHKLRLWLVMNDSTIGWYLPVASNNGMAEPFYFGPKFNHGGELDALINWTVDGGNGADDYLVAVSSAGDVIPYQGADPESIDGTNPWTTVGTYYIGKIPAGRRFFSEFSGELYLLSSFGLIAMSDLLVGVDSRNLDHKSLTYPIASIIRKELFSTSDQIGWEPLFLPSRGILLITSPLNTLTDNYTQYVMNIVLEGWGLFRDVPATVVAEWDNRVFFGTADNRLCITDVPRDNVLIDTEDPLALGVPVEFSLLTAYSLADQPSLFKRGQMVRPDFISILDLTYRAKILYDYEITETLFNILPADPGAAAQWDISLWDIAVWGGSDPTNRTQLLGAGGMGRAMAVAIQGEVTEDTRLLSFDVMWIPGGPI